MNPDGIFSNLSSKTATLPLVVFIEIISFEILKVFNFTLGS